MSLNVSKFNYLSDTTANPEPVDTAKNSKAPSLEEILAKKGIHKDATFGDYQEYIIEKEKHIRPRLFGRGLLSEGSMHLALKRIIPTRFFYGKSWLTK